MNLDELRAALRTCEPGAHLALDAGSWDVTETLRIATRGIRLVGDAGGRTVLRRGRLADGRLFGGALLEVSGTQGASVAGLRVDGGRFERRGLVWIDHRHPLTSRRSSARFPCASRLPEPDCYDPRHFAIPVTADLYIVDAHDTELSGIQIGGSMSLGIAVGPGCRDTRLARVRIERAGQYGIWIGAGLGMGPVLPLAADLAAKLPAGVALTDCTLAHCGASGAFVEGRDVRFERCRWFANHRDFPFNEAGGQLVIDYKSEGITVRSCRIEAGARLTRRVAVGGADGLRFERRSFGAVGVEASGRDLAFIDNVMTGNACEAIHLNGANGVTISGVASLYKGNHRMARRWWGRRREGATEDICITTSAHMAAVGAVSGDVSVGDIAAPAGVLVWSDGSIPGLRVDGVRVAGPHLPVRVGLNPDGSSLRGEGWVLAA